MIVGEDIGTSNKGFSIVIIKLENTSNARDGHIKVAEDIASPGKGIRIGGHGGSLLILVGVSGIVVVGWIG